MGTGHAGPGFPVLSGRGTLWTRPACGARQPCARALDRGGCLERLGCVGRGFSAGNALAGPPPGEARSN